MHFTQPSYGQTLQPGFDQHEYLELLRAYSRWGDSVFCQDIPESKIYKPVYRSPAVGLENRWALYKTDDQVGVICLRGTTRETTSWLANVYAAMTPAKGELHLSDSLTFNYQLAENPKAAVHVGWLASTAYLATDILAKIDSCYRTGIKDYVIFGHSQGGAIAYLLTSHLLHMQKTRQIPADIQFKTYCSAAPKPGNLYYAYEFENSVKGGWAYNVVNATDWVPETPVSIQTVDDFNTINPFVNAKASIKKQKFPKNIAFARMYNQLTKDTERAQKKYEKYLGRLTSRFVKKHLADFQPPEYYHSNHYVRTGNTIVLMPDAGYYKKYPNDQTNAFVNHGVKPYLYLAEKMPPEGPDPAPKYTYQKVR